MEELELCIDMMENQIDIICLSEHWLSTNQVDSIVFNDFALATYFARDKARGGGVAIYTRISKKIKFEPRPDIAKLSVEKCFEVCGIQLLTSTPLIIVTIYRTPQDTLFSKFMLKLDRLFRNISDHTPSSNVCVIGDFNVDFNKESQKKMELINLMNMYNFKSNIDGFTRCTANSSTTIDNVLTNFNLISKPINIETGLSDHVGQIVIVPYIMDDSEAAIEKSKHVMRRVFNKTQISGFVLDISMEEWASVFNAETTEAKYNCFLKTFLLYFEKHFPRKSIINKNSTRPAWITCQLKEAMIIKRKLYLESRNNNTAEFKAKFKEYKKQLAKKVASSKRDYNDNFIKKAENKIKATWNVINSTRGTSKDRSKDNNIKLLINNKKVNEPTEVANSLNTYFNTISELIMNTSIDTMEECRIKLENRKVSTNHIMELNETSPNEIMNIIRKFKLKKSSGWDEVPISILKHTSHIIAGPMSYICNSSFKEGVFPSKLKLSVIKPLYKKGCKNNMSNYRPLALLSTFSKIFEKLVLERIMRFVNSSSLLGENQHGFRESYSTTTATYDLLHSVNSGLDNKEITATIMCDLSKAFDTIDSKLMLMKLEYYGVGGLALEWIRSYLSDRKQKVQIVNNTSSVTSSKWTRSLNGLPQGAILSPILFSIFVNDLANNVPDNVKVVQYADDTSLVIKGRTEDELRFNIQRVIVALDSWFAVNKLKLNCEKTCIIRYKAQGIVNESPIIVSNVSLEFADKAKFLGITVDHRLKWGAHINNICKKLSSEYYMIKTLLKHCNFNTAMLVYYSHVQSQMQYGLRFWGAAGFAKKVFMRQKRIIRVLTGSGSRTSCRDLFKKLNV